ncbi:polysaccharide pyruvyl transferase family protein [Patescibacteria group bacterium]
MPKQKKAIKITYLGGAWPTNIGNAFIDLGSIQSLKMACPNAIVHFSSEIPQWVFYSQGKNFRNALEPASLIKSDYLVVSGVLFCDEFIKLYESTISKIIKNNTKFIINGGGSQTYSKKEVENFRNFLKRNPPYALISRDELSFKNYGDLAEHSHNGIDCGFFVSDCFIPTELNLPDFVIFNFDESNIHKLKNTLLLKKSAIKPPSITDKLVIRTHHSCWPIWRKGPVDLGVPNNYFNRSHTLISDIPDDYLNLYNRAKATYSSRVHACVATLSFGNPAMLFSQTKRSSLFDRVGAGAIKEGLTHPNKEKIKQEKLKHLKFLSSILK